MSCSCRSWLSIVSSLVAVVQRRASALPMNQLRPAFVNSRRFATRPECMRKLVTQQRDGAAPIAEFSLTEQPRTRIPRTVVALAQPAEIGGIRQEQKQRLAERAGEMR